MTASSPPSPQITIMHHIQVFMGYQMIAGVRDPCSARDLKRRGLTWGRQAIQQLQLRSPQALVHNKERIA
jgi:hypothetical protein